MFNQATLILCTCSTITGHHTFPDEETAGDILRNSHRLRQHLDEVGRNGASHHHFYLFVNVQIKPHVQHDPLGELVMACLRVKLTGRDSRPSADTVVNKWLKKEPKIPKLSKKSSAGTPKKEQSSGRHSSSAAQTE